MDILFLGSSHSYRSFDPRIFQKNGYVTFNLGTSAQTPLQTKLLVDRYLKALNPKLIVYEVYGGSFAFDGTESSLDILSNDSNDMYSIQLALQQRSPKVWNALLYAELQSFLGLATSNEPRTRYGETYVDGGYTERYEIAKAKEYQQETWNLREDQFEAFRTITKFIKQNGIPLLLVQAPIAKARYAKITNTKYFDERMNKEGIYVNFNDSINLIDTVDFYDSHHLNQHGVIKFNSVFLQYLKRRE